MDYLAKLEQSLRFTWKYKLLWPFGLILAVFGGGGSYSNFSSSGGELNNTDNNIDLSNGQIFAVICGIAVLALVLSFVGWYLTSIANGALIKSVEWDQKKQDISFKKAWKFGVSKAFAFIKLDLVTFAIALVISIPLILVMIVSALLPFLFCALCFLIPLYIVIYLALAIIHLGAQRYLVLKDMGAWDSFIAGYDLMKKAFVDYLIGWLFSLLPGCLWTMVMLPLAVVIGVFLVVMIAIFIAINPIIGIIALVGVILLLLVLSAIVNSPFTVFMHTYWTKLIMEMMEK